MKSLMVQAAKPNNIEGFIVIGMMSVNIIFASTYATWLSAHFSTFHGIVKVGVGA